MKQHLIIPILIPELEYDYNCIFAKKSNYGKVGNGLTKDKLIEIIEGHLENLERANTFVEIELYISTIKESTIEEKEDILKVLYEYKKQGKIDDISVNSYAKNIDNNMIKLLKKYKIKNVCIKCMTSNDYLLKNCKFGYEFKDVKKIVRKLRWRLFNVYSDIMIGLPESTTRDDLDTAEDLCNIKIKGVNIYTPVIENGSNLQELQNKGDYKLLSTVQVVEELKEIIKLFDKNKITINKIGNQDVEENENKDLRKIVESAIWYEHIVTKIKNFNVKVKEVEIQINPENEEKVIGYEKENITKLKNVYDVDLKIKKDEKMSKRKSKITILKTYSDFAEEN